MSFDNDRRIFPGLHDAASKSAPEIHERAADWDDHPFEPEWEGHVTLEISNTTPLPARIYANEGIAQVLFFEADEDDVCETSYADKQGKYQAQRGVTLPRI